jgi:branched-subunit amino acid aminotransferase/4-amino-4-deoxychorismate lyase
VKVIFNGALLDQHQTVCDDKGWLPGNGIFETIKTVDSKPWAFARHMRRAINSASSVGAKIPDESSLRSGVELLLKEQSHSPGMLRLSFGSTGDWLAVHLAYSELVAPAKIMTYPQMVSTEGSQVKRFPYDHRVSIVDFSKNKGFDEAIVLNPDNKVSEAGVSNLLIKIGDSWWTPPLSDGALPGVVRALVIENFDVGVRSIDASEIKDIESAFLIGSLRIAQPIESIDSRELVQSLDFKSEIEAMALRTSVG